MQDILGAIPYEFTRYWIDRFPHFLSHSFHALEQCSHENLFKCYYSSAYIFDKPDYFYATNTQDFVPTYDNTTKYTKENRTNNRQITTGTGFDIQLSPGKQQLPNRKGSYNFHKTNNDTNNESNMAGGLTYRKHNLKKRKDISNGIDYNVKWTLPAGNGMDK